MEDPFAGIVGTDQVRLPAEGERTLDGISVTAVVRPGSAEEVAACLDRARECGTALVPSGAATKLGWGNRCDAERVVRLDLVRLREPLALDPEEGITTAAAGVPVAALERAARAQGKFSSLDSAHAGATVGGTIAADPVHPEDAPERRLRDDLLGLEVALSNGTLTKSGGRVVKNVTGFDLVRLYCGSLGTLGVITEATLRLRPVPEVRGVLARAFASLEPACAAARELAERRVEPAGVAVLRGAEGLRLLWLLEGDKGEVELRARRFDGTRCEASEWDGVRAAAAGEAAADGVRVRVSARASDAPEIGRALASLAGADAVRLALPRAGVLWAEVAEGALPGIFEACARSGWSLFVERASAELKRTLDVFGPAPDALPLMRVLKRRFDPGRVLSPGRFVGRI